MAEPRAARAPGARRGVARHPLAHRPEADRGTARCKAGSRSAAARGSRAAASADARGPLARGCSKRRAAQRGVSELSYQLTFLETVTGSPTNGGTRARAMACSTQDRSTVGGAEAPKCTARTTPDGPNVATTCD